jgi:hypothetical protein
MMSMTAAVVRLSLLASAVVLAAGCSTIETVSPGNLRVEVVSADTAYASSDTFVGSFTFANRTLRPIRAQFGSDSQSQGALYDGSGNEVLTYRPGGSLVITYLDLPPLGTRTDSVRLPLLRGTHPSDSALAPGTYRFRMWVFGHEDIFSETTFDIR